MAKQERKLFAFNRGITSKLGLARVDVERIALSAETQTNWMPRVLGSMMLRPGLQYLLATKSNLAAKYLEFIYSASDTALIELTNLVMRVVVSDALITRPTVATAITNGTFAQTTTTATISNATPAVVTYAGADSYANGDTIAWTTTGGLPSPLAVGVNYYIINISTAANTFNLSLTSGGAAINTTTAGSGTHTLSDILGWIANDESGAASLYNASGLALTGTLTAAAIRRQTLTVAGGDQNVRHAIKVIVSRGTCVFRVGSTSTGDEYVTKTTLGRGEHSLSFIPTAASVYLQVENSTQATALVTSITMAAAGVMEVTTPWATADLTNIRISASADVIFVACSGKQQMKIERRAAQSWSCVYYEPNDGPFKVENITPAKLAPSVLTGSGVTITATGITSLFKSTDVGRLVKIRSIGQSVTQNFTANGQVSESILVTAVGSSRTFPITITGTWVATVALQRSVGDTSSWVTVASYTTNQSTTYNDALDNQTVYYRFTTTAYTSGTAVASLNYTLGSSTGIGRVTAFTNSLAVVVDVLDSFGSTTATATWSLGIWGDTEGWPSAVALTQQGRLWWGGKTWIIGSVSDGYSSFDDSIVGDSAPIIRTISFGPVDVINWLAAAGRLLIGTAGSEFMVSSSNLDELITPATFSIRPVSSLGSAQTAPAMVDNAVVFSRRGGTRVFEIDEEYKTGSLSTICPDITDSAIIEIGVQRQPDTRIHFVRTDGKVAVLILDKVEKVFCWILVETDGVIENVVVLPGTLEDSVYYVVKRTIGGVDKRYLEKWALESEARGGAINKIGDSLITYSGASTATITGLTHLEGKSVVAWGNSKPLGTYTVSGGSITLSEAVTSCYVGLSYTAQFKSAKSDPLFKRSKIDHIGLILADTHYQGLEYGQDFTTMDNLPLMEDGAAVATDYLWTDYHQDTVEFPGKWSKDSRICLRATAPKPCTVVACEIDGAANEK